MLRIIILLIIFFSSLIKIAIFLPLTNSNKVGSIQMNRINYKRCGEIIIGNQKYNLAFNLDSTDFWVVSNELSTFKLLNKTENIKETGINGSLVKDTLMIGDVKIKNIPFIVVQSIPNTYSNNYKTDGVLGLSSISDETNNNNNNPLQYLTKYIQNSIFTIFTKSNGELALPSQNEENVGKITFGSEDKDNCKKYNYVKLVEKSKLIVNILCGKINNTPLNSIISNNNNTKMNILEEELLMLAPQTFLEEIAKIMKLTSQGDDTGFYLFKEGSCNKDNINKLPTITLTVGDCEKQAEISIYPKQYLQYTALGDCRLLIADSVMMGYENGWYMGAQFFEDRCIAMNWNEGTIGFADAENNKN
ncbi:Peptidase A1 domain-containing protein [Meloidogyne graminicola]|uniref:Peptidase A1 domain-containing protein n=1 Tax=Meloidogyne graminicola TaxID=189291 RepID=A0A8S9ZZ61_9BILA|nr:Peptidase A1 domain-containing protein [Meloidogyne graminicola]